jgi:predicted esterase
LPDERVEPARAALVDPLCFLEGAPLPARALPAIHALCGTADPIADDTRRLARALARFELVHAEPFYAGGGHAFHGFLWSELAQRAWRDQLAFLARVVPAAATQRG